MITTSFPVSNNPASGIFVERLISHLPNSIHATILIPCSSERLASNEERRYRLTCFKYGPRRWLRLAHRPGGIPDALRRRDPAILLLPLFIPAMLWGALRLTGKVDVLHGNWSIAGIVAAIAGRLRGRPAIVTLRGEDVTRAEKSRLFRTLLAACLALNRYTVTVSEDMCGRLRRHYPKYASRIRFIPNGVAVPSDRERSEPHVPLRLVTVGSLIRRKRIETLIQAVSHLKDGSSGAVLRIIGDGNLNDELEAEAQRLGVAEMVEFVGGVPPAEVERHLQWADVFVFGSESEGRPNVILEAMAAGLPIVSTDIPGVRELIPEDIGLLYPVGDAHALVKHIRQLAADPGHARGMGDRARQRILDDNLSWEAAGERYAMLYRTVVED